MLPPDVNLQRWDGPVRDERKQFPVMASVQQFQGRVIGVRSDTVDVDGHVVTRDVVVHPGAVAVVALDQQERVLLVRQYRHPVGQLLWEVPAGLLDKAAEDPAECARRELLEEGGAVARELHLIGSWCVTPGGSDEVIHVYLATDVTLAEDGRVLTGEAEEADMPQVWLPMQDALDLVASGQIHNTITIAALHVAARQIGSRAT